MEKLRQMYPRGRRFVPSFAGGYASVKPALPNEDPALVQGVCPVGITLP